MAIPDLVGRDVLLIPMRQDDVRLLLLWARERDPGTMVADIVGRYPSELFDDAYPQKGRSFRIERRGDVLGAAMYHPLFGTPRATRLELVLPDATGPEDGADAIDTLARYVFEEHLARDAWAEVPPGDARVLAAFLAAGFEERGLTADGARRVLRRSAPQRTSRKPK